MNFMESGPTPVWVVYDLWLYLIGDVLIMSVQTQLTIDNFKSCTALIVILCSREVLWSHKGPLVPGTGPGMQKISMFLQQQLSVVLIYFY